MPPYFDQYQDGYPFQYYQEQFQQNQPQNVVRPGQAQAIVPQQPSGFAYTQPQAQPQDYYPVQQHNQVAYFNSGSVDPTQYYNQQAFAQNQPPSYFQQNSYAYPPNVQYQQRYQPPPPPQQQQPPPPQVMVPPSPRQNFQISQQTLQQSPRPQPVQTPSIQMPPKKSTPQNRVLHDVQPTTPRQPTVTKPQIPEPPSVPSTEYPSMLLALADEYLEASKNLEERTQLYYKLLSTALGCMEIALRNFKLPPLREAQLSLRYAQLLYDETNNLDEAESLLTKSIDLCERMKFVDLKYAMQLLLARVLFRSKPRAAIRDLQSMISDIETYRHTAWEYPFRFQAVFFSMANLTSSSLHDALHQLERIRHLSKQNADHSVYAFAALLESLIHLNDANPDGQTHAQTALAAARSLQLNPDVEKHPQIIILMEYLDIIYNLITNQADDDLMKRKRDGLTKVVSGVVHENPNWTKDELLWLRLNSKSLKGVPTQDGGLVQDVNGKHYIALSWMGRQEVEAIGFLIKAMCLVPLDRNLQFKAEKFLTEGYKIPDSEIPNPPAAEDGQVPHRPITIKDEVLRSRCHLLAAHFQAELVLLCITRGNFRKAQEGMAAIELHLKDVDSGKHLQFDALLEFLKGCIQQANGNLNAALNHFQSQALALQSRPQPSTSINKTQGQHTNPALVHLQLLAAMNTALIIRPPSHPQNKHLRPLIDTIATYITPTTPPSLISTYKFLLSVLPNASTLQTKQLLSSAMTTAREIKNHQITSFALTLIQERFFRGGPQNSQAVSSAKAAAHQVRMRWANPLWLAISGGMEVESLVLQSTGILDEPKREEIERRKEEAGKAWAIVPEKVRLEMEK